MNKTVILFGTGSTSKRLKDELPIKIAYFVDNDRTRHNTYFEEKLVQAPSVLLDENKETVAIIVASQYYEEIAKQLEHWGFIENVHFWNGFFYLQDIRQETGASNQALSNTISGMPDFTELRIENTNLCPYKCIFCPRDKMTRRTGIMSFEDFHFVMKKIKNANPGFAGRVLLQGFGEPLVDTNLPEKVYSLRKYFPEANTLMISTLGVKRDKSYFEKLVQSGMDNINISMYAVQKNLYAQIHGFDGFEIATDNLLKLIDIWHKQPTFIIRLQPVPWKWYENISISEDEARNSYITFLKDISYPFNYGIDEMNPHNFGDGRDFRKRDTITCSVVGGARQRILEITWDLKIRSCCFDYNASTTFGNLTDTSLQEVFTSISYKRFMEAHRQGSLDNYPSCRNCDMRQ